MNDTNGNLGGMGRGAGNGLPSDVALTPHVDEGLDCIDVLLARAGAADRADASRERLDRIIAATTPMVVGAPPEVVYPFRDLAAKPRARLSAVRIAAGLAFMLSVGAAIMASRSHATHGPSAVIAISPDETSGLELFDRYFEKSGTNDAWTDAEALHTRVSADANSYWGADDLFSADSAQSGESL